MKTRPAGDRRPKPSTYLRSSYPLRFHHIKEGKPPLPYLTSTIIKSFTLVPVGPVTSNPPAACNTG